MKYKKMTKDQHAYARQLIMEREKSIKDPEKLDKLRAHINEIYEFINDNFNDLNKNKFLNKNHLTKLLRIFADTKDIKTYLDAKLSVKAKKNPKKPLQLEESYVIRDWAGNMCFNEKEFGSFDDAEDFLSEKLGEDYETDRQEYEIVAWHSKNPKKPKWSIQSVIVSREVYDNVRSAEAEAKKFARKDIIRVDTKDNYYRFRVREPSKYSDFRTVDTPASGVKLIYGEEK